jgi:hypothetical protein
MGLRSTEIRILPVSPRLRREGALRNNVALRSRNRKQALLQADADLMPDRRWRTER